MSIRVEKKGNKTTVETDFFDGYGTVHSAILNDPELRGGMKCFGIDKIEVHGVGDGADVIGAVYDEFDRQYKEKYGRDTGYLRP
jgi:hypothetical protein